MMSRLFGPFSKGRKESPERKTATASAAPSVSKPAPSAALNQVEWSIETLDDVPDGLPFTNGRGYLRFHRIDSSLKGGEVDTFYADSEAVKALTCIVAAAEDAQALLARDNGLPRLATYFDNLWGLDPGDWFKGGETDIDNRHAAWLVRKPPTPTGKRPKHPYEVWFNAEDYGQVNYSHGTVWYRADGSVSRMQVVYWRAGTMYDVRFAPLDGKFAPTSIIRASSNARETVWSVKG